MKYLAALIIPILSMIAVWLGGFYAWTPLIFAFVFIPLIEPLFPNSSKNHSEETKNSLLHNRFFDFLLYLNIPIIYGILFSFLYFFQSGVYSTAESIGLIFSLGTLLGACGINVAHELGHRNNKVEQKLAKILLLPSLYMHFYIEHNRGHHKRIATPEDPASARFNENIYSFWLRSLSGGIVSAWNIEKTRLSRQNKTHFSLQNEMLLFVIIQLVYLLVLVSIFSLTTMLVATAVAVFSFLLLESINYVEHYGLQRKKLDSGRYEQVKSYHSWNSNHQLGRIILYELTRHSDHHFISTKKYQLLDHHDESPQLPYGYPSSMLLSLVPPLWFKKMNREVLKYQRSI